MSLLCSLPLHTVWNSTQLSSLQQCTSITTSQRASIVRYLIGVCKHSHKFWRRCPSKEKKVIEFGWLVNACTLHGFSFNTDCIAAPPSSPPPNWSISYFSHRQNKEYVNFSNSLGHFSLISLHLTIHGHFINLCGVVLFNITQNPDVVVLHKVDGNTLPAETTWATNPVKRQNTHQLDHANNNSDMLTKAVLHTGWHYAPQCRVKSSQLLHTTHGSGLPITRAAAANQNITYNILHKTPGKVASKSGPQTKALQQKKRCWFWMNLSK